MPQLPILTKQLQNLKAVLFVMNSTCAPFKPCFTQESCASLDYLGQYGVSLYQQWIYFFVILSIGLALIFIAEVIPRLPAKLRSRFINLCEKEHPENDHGFVNTRRSESNFIRSNTNPFLEIPNPYGPEYEPQEEVGSFYPITSFWESSLSHVKDITVADFSLVVGTLGIAMCSSALSTYLWLDVYYERSCSVYANNETAFDWFNQIAGAVAAIISNFMFYPIFMITGYIAYVVVRWRDFLVNGHTIQARLHDVALLAGSSPTFPVSNPVKQKLYRIYRYLNLVHALCYKSVSLTVGPLQIETDFVDRLGLLLPEEVEVLLPMDNKIRDTVVAWLSSDVLDLLHTEGVRSDYVLELAASIRELRSICARHHGKSISFQPTDSTLCLAKFF